MDNYEGTLGTSQSRPSQNEDEFTKTVERYTSALPSSAYLGVAIGAMALLMSMRTSASARSGK